MARTYGEVLASSFADIFHFAKGPDTVFVDIGSGHGTLTVDAVRIYGCQFGLGIEKYREPAEICTAAVAKLPQELQAKLRFLLEDINDSDLPAELADLTYRRLILFCNNLAFNAGTVNRFGKKARAVMDKLADKEIIVISTVPLDALEDRFSTMVHLGMNWADELHETCIYISSPEPDNLAVLEAVPLTALPDVAAQAHFGLDSLCIADKGIIPRDISSGVVATK